MVRVWIWRVLAALATVVLIVAATSGACRRGDSQQRLLIRGAPSMDTTISALAREFSQWNPDVDVVTDCLCPPCVVYEDGAPETSYDLWAAWGEWELERLAQAGNLSFARTAVVGSTPLVVAAAGNAAHSIETIDDLRQGSVGKIGVGDPDLVASGHHAREHLTTSGLWADIEDRLVLSRSGCELLKWLGLGREVDVAIVLGACVTHDSSSVELVREIPEELCPPIPLLFAVPEDAPSSQAVDLFMQFLETPQAKAILAADGIDPEGGR
jgi:molybdenum ABC transporter molybdate-binding protein